MSEKLQSLIQEAIDESMQSRDPAITLFTEIIVIKCFEAAMIESKGHMNPIDLMTAMKLRVGLE